jgi:hypothetical protein
VTQCLRKLKRSERINNPTYRPFLPFSWNTLGTIDNPSDAAFLYGIAHGIIAPRCQYKDIKKLRDEFPEPNEDASAATVEAPERARSRQLQDIKAKMARYQARLAKTPRPLYVSADSVLLEFHRPELAKVVEDLNERLPKEYPFISEVRLAEPKHRPVRFR